MTPNVNQFGLSRTIPPDVMRAVRQRDGFGCVCCGCAIIEYHHADPPFKAARSHDPNGITCLCGGCHGKVSRGILSAQTIHQAMKNPYCRRAGFSHDEFDLDNPAVVLGSVTITGTPNVIRFGNEDLLRIEGHEEPGTPFRISGRFYDDDGQLLFEIERNEWKAPVSNWDIEIKGPRWTIRKKRGTLALVLRVDPPSSIFVDRLDMVYRGVRIFGRDSGDFCVSGPGGGVISFGNGTISGCGCGIFVSEEALSGSGAFASGGYIDAQGAISSGNDVGIAIA